MKTQNLNPEVTLLAVANELSSLLAQYDETEQPREKTAKADLIIQYIRGDSSIFNRAHEILDANINAVISEFISKTRPFFNDETRARRVAEETDLVRSLHHQRNSLAGESIDSARNIEKIFRDFVTSSASEPMQRGEQTPSTTQQTK